MKIITSIQEMRQAMILEKQNGRSIGFVPTMGFLHEGHLSLVKRAVKENDFVVMSIFVNPLQFGPNEDFDRYPRNLEKDKQAAETAGVDLIFHPSTEEMYSDEPTVSVSVNKRTDVLCGKSRPGHFDGVATVLTKLFHIVMPDRVYFGMKDAQQVAVVDGLIENFNFPITLVACPTIREADGLAKSSRNVYLSETEREEAPALYKGLLRGAELFRDGTRDMACLQKAVFDVLNDRLTQGEIEYTEVLTYPQLKKTKRCEGRIIIAIAVRFEKARLIDNMILDEEDA